MRNSILISFSHFVAIFFAAGCVAAPLEVEMQRYQKVQAVATDQAAKQNVLTRMRYPADGIDLGVCTYWSEDLGLSEKVDQHTLNLIDIAGFVHNWKRELSQAESPFPRAFWEPLVSAAEAALIDLNSKQNISSKRLDKLANRRARRMGDILLRWSGRHRVRNLSITVACEGGAGGPRDVLLRSLPTGAALYLIPEFSYDLCKLDVDAEDRDRCRAWRRVEAGGKATVSGFYYIHAAWPDGTRKTERYDFRSVQPNDLIEVGK